MTNEERQEHVEYFAYLQGCALVQQPEMPGMMFVEYDPPMIEGPVICNQRDYVVMLHELGHVEEGHTQGRPGYEGRQYYFDNGVLLSEAEAWWYALNACKEELEQETRNFMWQTCLGSYYRGAKLNRGRKDCVLMNGNRHHVKFEYDVPDEFFWNIADEIAGYPPGTSFGEGPWRV